MRVAEQIAEQFGNDGQRWQDSAGRELVDVCREQCVTSGRARSRWDEETSGYVYEEVARGEQVFDVERYQFSDGSAIVVAGDAWDVEGATPFSWAGA